MKLMPYLLYGVLVLGGGTQLMSVLSGGMILTLDWVIKLLFSIAALLVGLGGLIKKDFVSKVSVF